MLCKNVHVARPSCSTSGGHPGGGSSPLYKGAAAFRVPVVDALVDAVVCPLLEFALLVVGGFQYRNAVHILQGFPSGPITIPGGMPA